MAFFPDRFHAQPDPRTGQVRLAVRVSEGRVSEYWLDPAEVAQIIDVPVDGEWHGDGMIQLRFKNNAGQLALHEDNDTRSLIRAPESTLRSLQAHLRSALLALEGVPLKPTKGMGVVVREAMAAELGTFRDDLQLMMREEIRAALANSRPLEPVVIHQTITQTPVAPEPPVVEAPEVPDALPEVVLRGTPTFVPSEILSGDVSGSLDVTEKESSGDDLEEAAAALRTMRGKAKKKTTPKGKKK
mgnify:CR=1 FL=1